MNFHFKICIISGNFHFWEFFILFFITFYFKILANSIANQWNTVERKRDIELMWHIVNRHNSWYDIDLVYYIILYMKIKLGYHLGGFRWIRIKWYQQLSDDWSKIETFNEKMWENNTWRSIKTTWSNNRIFLTNFKRLSKRGIRIIRPNLGFSVSRDKKQQNKTKAKENKS